MFSEKWKKEIVTLPNLLSFFRICLIPVYLSVYRRAASQGQYLLAGAILSVSCMTDMIDGMIARKCNQISTVGKVLDPLADKLTQFSVIICLVLDHPVLWVIVGLFVVKELFQLIAGIITLRKGKMLKGALISGKVSTAVLFTSLISMIIFPMTEEIIGIITIVDCVVLLIAFADYFRTYYQNTSMIDDLQQ